MLLDIVLYMYCTTATCVPNLKLKYGDKRFLSDSNSKRAESQHCSLPAVSTMHSTHIYYGCGMQGHLMLIHNR